MIICIIIKMHCKRLLKIMIYTASLQRTRGAPTTCPHSVRYNTLNKRQAAAVFSMLKTNAAAWRSMRLHSAHTALLATAQRATRRTAIF